jgi:hypothetical protein
MYTITVYDDIRLKNKVATLKASSFDELLKTIKEQMQNGLHCQFVNDTNPTHKGTAYAARRR